MTEAARRQFQRMADHAIEEFLGFMSQATARTWTSEVAFEIGSGMRVRNLYRADAVEMNGDQPVLKELAHTQADDLTRQDFSVSGVDVTLYPASWCDLEIASAKPIAETDFLSWFDEWFGLESGRDGQVESGQPGQMIHVAMVAEGVLYLDMGTSPPDALFELIECLATANHTRLRLGRSPEDSS